MGITTLIAGGVVSFVVAVLAYITKGKFNQVNDIDTRVVVLETRTTTLEDISTALTDVRTDLEVIKNKIEHIEEYTG